MSDERDNQKPPEEASSKDAPATPTPAAPTPATDAPKAAAPAEEAKPAAEAPPAPSEEDEAAKKAEAEAKAKAAAEARAKKAAEKAAIEAAKPPWQRDAVTPEWEEADDDPLVKAITEKFGDAILSAKSYAGDMTFEVVTGSIAEVAQELKTEHAYLFLVDLCGADYPDREARFDVVYQLHSFEANRRIRLRVMTDETTPVPTVCGLWKVANWLEREAYDMYGMRFEGHPDMTRILLWEGFNGYPLRKDFPVEGIDTGSAIYPEYYEEQAGPVAGTGTGWKPAEPPEPEATDEGSAK